MIHACSFADFSPCERDDEALWSVLSKASNFDRRSLTVLGYLNLALCFESGGCRVEFGEKRCSRCSSYPEQESGIIGVENVQDLTLKFVQFTAFLASEDKPFSSCTIKV